MPKKASPVMSRASFSKLILFTTTGVCAIFIAACATESAHLSADQVRREMASETQVDQVNQEMNQLSSAQDPVAYVNQKVDVLVNAYLVGEKLKDKFDARLAELLKQKEDHPDADLHILDSESQTYSQLLALGTLRHEQEDKLIALQTGLMATKYPQLNMLNSVSPLTPEQAQQALSHFYEKIQTPSGVDRLALHELHQRVINTHKKFKTLAGSVGLHQFSAVQNDKTESLAASFEDGIDSQEDLIKIAQKPGTQDEIRARVKSVNIQNGEIGETFRTTAPQIEQMLKDIKNNRDPQAVAQNIHPSPGTQGSITGATFPPGAWAMTFDDGPHPSYTAQILKNLNDQKIPATFFELAQNVTEFPIPAALVVASGDTSLPHPNALANHSFTHPQINKLSAAGMHHEIADAADVLTKKWDGALKDYQSKNKSADARIPFDPAQPTIQKDLRPRFFRLPYGAGTKDARIRDLLTQTGMVHVFWNVDSLDWQDHNPDSVYRRALGEMKLEGHGVILFHDIHPQTIAASLMVMKYINSQPTMRAVSIPQIVNEVNCPASTDGTLVPCPTAWRATNW